jgi:hypothetical protein
MKKLLATYRSLPKEVQMLIALAGLGTPLGIIYVLREYVFPGVSIFVLVLGIAAVVGVLSIAGWLVPKLFGGATRARQRRMESELATSAEGGTVSMSLRAAVKSNNEKFFTAIKEMKKLGISVYDLPWYIVIGDSGCGKTKLINEGGLTFSTGKPEGYQLGTLNYNWWFTEDAIFVDMAGRLCNPQDDADYREWDAFLKTVGQGRRGYPINGVLLCVSAEHLLQDPPEKHEQDANTMLERLRDLQSKLGVTFATYLVITKCDKIVGFMPFFDRAERDITIKNQIFGFSRSGDFNELYDPERFGDDFGALYGRLTELRLRRLQDDVDEAELGLAYSFPEEFRQFKEPLHTYVRTLFPAIKNPRAVKNLIFRGVYFTSATQQGGLILRHLTERLGAAAANTFQPLESLYPRPRPHFVKELLFRKVFPEQGLVFRNEQEVVRNRQLARFLLVGSGLLGAVLIALVIISSLKFGTLIKEPRARAEQAGVVVGKPTESLKLTLQLGQDVKTLKASAWPTILSLGIGSREPVDNLTQIQVGLFAHSVIKPILQEVDSALRAGQIAGGAASGLSYDDYEKALLTYITWFGCANEERLPEAVDYDSFAPLLALVPPTNTVLLQQKEQILEQAQDYFLVIRGMKGATNPAHLLTEPEFKPPETITLALTHVHKYAERCATLSEDALDPIIAEWMRIRNRCDRIETSYAALLAAGDITVATEDQLDAFRTTFDEHYARFAGAMKECAWQLPAKSGFLRIPQLREAIRAQRQAWLARQQALQTAYAACGGRDDAKDPVTAAITALISGNGAELRGLDRVLADSIKQAGLAERDYFPDYYGEAFDKLVREVDEAYGHIITVKRGADAARDDKIELAPQLEGTIAPVLKKVADKLATLNSGDVKAATAAEWSAALKGLLYPGDTAGDTPAATLASLDARWQSAKLQKLNDTYQTLVRKGAGTVLLRTIEARLQAAGPWGLGEFAADAQAGQRSAYYIPLPAAAAAAPVPEPKKADEPPAPVAKPPAGGPPPLAPKSAPPPAPAAPPTPGAPAVPPPAERTVAAGQIPACASPDYLNARAMELVQLASFLGKFGPEYYFSRTGDPTPLHQRCANLLDSSWRTYCGTYAEAWSTAYKGKTFAELKRVGRFDQRWGPFAEQFRLSPGAADNEARNSVQQEFQPALAEVLHATRWALYSAELGGWWLEQKDEFYGAAKSKVASAFGAAMQEQWGGGAFARSAKSSSGPANDPKPWDTLAGAFATRWIDWCNAVGKDAKLPRRFDVDDPAAKAAPIPWTDLAGLRGDTGLADERLTGQLYEFQQSAQTLLSAELTAILAGVQTDSFADQSAFEGWPYVNAAGTGLTALETVAFDQFSKFLLAIQRAEAAFSALEQGLPDEPLRKTRQAFLQACAQWRDFLKLNAQGEATRLEVSVWTEDPLGTPQGRAKVDDSAQHYYKQVCLSIGLRPSQGGDAATRALCFQTTERGKAKSVPAVWEWTRAPDMQELTFALTDGVTPEGKNYTYPAIKPEVLGRPAPLAFCAYLHRYGVFADGNWVVSHGVSLADKFKDAGKPDLATQLPTGERQIGEKFIFQLAPGRVLPGPIAPLTSAGGQ